MSKVHGVNMPSSWEPIRRARCVALTTYKKDGVRKPQVGIEITPEVA